MPYTERQVASALLDQPEFEGLPQKLFICSSPRSGSNTLCRMLLTAGLGIPHEYFNPVFIPEIAGRFGIDAASLLAAGGRNRVLRLLRRKLDRDIRIKMTAAYAKALIRYRTQSGVFSCKIQYWQYERLLNNPAGWRMLDGAAFVFLYRKDLLGQAVSAHFARITGRWDFDDAPTTAPEARPNFFDVDRLRFEIRYLAEEDRQWRVFFAENGITPAFVAYEDLCSDPEGVVNRIASVLGKSPGKAPGIPSERYPEDPTKLPRKKDVADKFVESVRKLRPAETQVAF